MQIIKHKQKNEKIVRNCQFCGEKYEGHPISKYCPQHKDPKHRKKDEVTDEKKVIVLEGNKLISHELFNIKFINLKCDLEGCKNTYKVEIVPKQYVYPRYCLEHRNSFKRKLFTNAQNKKNNINTKKCFLLDGIILPDKVSIHSTKTNDSFMKNDDKKTKVYLIKRRLLLPQYNHKFGKQFIKISEKEARKKHYGIARCYGRVNTIAEINKILSIYYNEML